MKYGELKRKFDACNQIRKGIKKKTIAYCTFYNHYVHNNKCINEIVNMECKVGGAREGSRCGKFKLSAEQIKRIIYSVKICGNDAESVCRSYGVSKTYYTYHYNKLENA